MTILTEMDVNHPAAKMVVNTARAQEEEVGDGTTTATIMAGALLAEGLNQAVRGVPVTRIIDGIKAGVARAVQVIEERAVKVASVDDPVLREIATVAGRGNKDIADLVFSAAKMVGMEKLLDESFKLSETIVAKEGAGNEVFAGIIIDKTRLNEAMPLRAKSPKILVVDDAFEPMEVEEEALGTESGFQKYLEAQEEFRADVMKVVDLGAQLIVVSKRVDDVAEQVLTDAGIMVVTRVSGRSLRRFASIPGREP
jgi:chaperonin GroEL (HSP60 family)